MSEDGYCAKKYLNQYSDDEEKSIHGQKNFSLLIR